MMRSLCSVAVAITALSGPALAVIINVPGDQPTIQAGIDAAVNGDEVVVAPGTYFEAIDFLGKAITVRSGDGPDVTIIDANGAGTVVTCDSGEGPGTVLEGFTITGGEVGIAGTGGGMEIRFSSPTVTNCTFIGNASAGDGGGMYLRNNSSPTVTNCTFIENTAGDQDQGAAGQGGGMYIYLNCTPTVADCTFLGNAANAGGAGVFCAGNATFTNCVFTGNDGTGMYIQNSPTVTNCTFSENIGDGLRLDFDVSSPTVTNCTFTANTGSGMNLTYGIPTVTNCTFSGNWNVGMLNLRGTPTLTNCTFTTNGGGGMSNNRGAVTLTNCTFSGNDGIGMANMNIYGPYIPTVTNCIFWGNSGPEITGDQYDPVVTYSDVQGGFTGIGNIDANPMFVDATDGDYRLQPGSPCIDAADNTAVPPDEFDLDEDGDADEPIPFDLDGNPRFVDDPDSPDCWQAPGTCGDPPIVDMGAYEFQGVGIVINLDIKPGSCPNSFNRGSHGVLPVALVGTADFDVTQIDIASVQLSRADGVGGSVTPHEGPPGPHSEFEDVATPFDAEPCDRHELKGDGITDLSMKFVTDEVVEALQLDDLPPGDLVELIVSGTLLDGTPFSAGDCIRLVPPGDLDGDGVVGILDLLALLAAWGTDPGGPPDFDGDGTVGILDLLTLLTNWGPCPEESRDRWSRPAVPRAAGASSTPRCDARCVSRAWPEPVPAAFLKKIWSSRARFAPERHIYFCGGRAARDGRWNVDGAEPSPGPRISRRPCAQVAW